MAPATAEWRMLHLHRNVDLQLPLVSFANFKRNKSHFLSLRKINASKRRRSLRGETGKDRKCCWVAQATGHMQRCVAIAVRQMRIGSILQQALGLRIPLSNPIRECTQSLEALEFFLKCLSFPSYTIQMSIADGQMQRRLPECCTLWSWDIIASRHSIKCGNGRERIWNWTTTHTGFIQLFQLATCFISFC